MTTKETTQSIDPLFKFAAPKADADTFIDQALLNDNFLAKMHDLVTEILTVDFGSRGHEVNTLRRAVDAVDDACRIEMMAFKAGFLFGVEYGRRQGGAS